MNRKDAAREIKGRWRELYPADDKGRGKGIICPICGSGGGPNGTGISEKKGSSSHFLKCWNGACDFNEGGSVIDLYMLEHGMNPQADFPRAVDELAEQLGIVIDAPARKTYAWEDFIPEDGEEPQDGEQLLPADPSFIGQTSAPASASAADPGQQGPTSAGGDTVEQVQGLTLHTTQPAEEPAEEPAADPTAKPARTFGGYYLASQKRLQDSPEARAYLQRRGISMETAARYVLGYDPAWISPTVIDKLEAEGNSWRPAGTPRIIIPSGYTHYVARDIRADAEIGRAHV